MENKNILQIQTDITDFYGALKILGISQATLINWEKSGGVPNHKAIYRGRMRKCYFIADLEEIKNRGNKNEKKRVR